MPGPPLPEGMTVDQMTAAVMLWIRRLTVSRRALRLFGRHYAAAASRLGLLVHALGRSPVPMLR